MTDTRPALSALLLAVALPLSAQGTPDVRVDVATAPGAANSHEVQLAATGNLVYAVWLDERSGSADVYCNRSLDGGATWLPQEVRLDTHTAPGAARSTEARVAADGATVCVAWTEDSGAPHIFFNRSLDAGATWLPVPLQLDVGGPAGTTSQMPAIACVASFVYVAWAESRAGADPDIYFTRSLDGGSTWLPATVRLDTGSAPGARGGSWSPRIATVVPNVYVVWDDFRSPNYGVFCNCSSDLGTTWLPSDVALNSGRSANGPISCLPQIAADGNAVYVCWSDDRFGGSDIFCQRSQDSGATWLPADVRVDVGNLPGSTRAGTPVIAAAGQSVHVAWRDSRNNANNADIYYNRSVDGGLNWGATDLRLDSGSPIGASDSSMPQLAAAGAAVAAVWTDNRFGSYDILCNTSADAGATWLVFDVRVDTGPGGSSSDSSRPALATNGASFVAAWEDLRNGAGADVYANVVAGYQTFGAGTPGTGGALPSLQGALPPVLGGTAAIEVRGGLGQAPALLAIGLGPTSRVAQPLLGGTLLVNPAATFFLLLGGAAGQPGAGAQILLPVPASFGLLGVDLEFQALLLDGGAVQGVSMTNGLSLWVG